MKKIRHFVADVGELAFGALFALIDWTMDRLGIPGLDDYANDPEE